MACYFIVEGARTETELYPFWIGLLRPDFNKVDKIEEISKAGDYCIESGHGHQITERIKGVLKKIEKDSIPVKCFAVVVDSEEKPPKKVKSDFEAFIAANNSIRSLNVLVLVQPICIEAWLLGNEKIYPKDNHPEYEVSIPQLSQFKKFYDTKLLDPELIPPLSGKMAEAFSVRAQFCNNYLRRVNLNKSNGRYSYRKDRLRYIKTKVYFSALKKRSKLNNEMKWFEFMVSQLQKL